MARNKITFGKEYTDYGRWKYTFTGSQRQPTLAEINNFIVEKHLGDEIDDYFGVAIGHLKPEEWVPPEDCLTIEIWGYDGGKGDGSCPVCNHERDFSGDRCPVCDKPWD